MITGEEVSDYIRDHSVLSYNFEKDEWELMISEHDAWELVLMFAHSICSYLESDEEIKVQSNAESGTLSESNRSSEKDA